MLIHGREHRPVCAIPPLKLGRGAAILALALLISGCAWPFGFRRAPERAAKPGAPLEVISGIERQPLTSQVARLIEALRHIGSPLPEADIKALEAAMAQSSDTGAAEEIQRILNAHCLLDLHINPEARVKIARGPAPAELVQEGWRAFLVRVRNEPRLTAALEAESENAEPTFSTKNANAITPADIAHRWMDVSLFNERPLNKELSGLPLEYRIIEIFSRDAGDREGHIAINAGHGTQDIGFRNDIHILFHAAAATPVELSILDEHGKPATASFTFRDSLGRVYPFADKRTVPDFFFQDQVYRSDGEVMLLPPGRFEVVCVRGPEYLKETRTIEVPARGKGREEFRLKRWIDPNATGWYSGDHHIHAAGCLHFKSPTLGVEPSIMMKHVAGEALNVGCVLTWGPAWYHQKQNFTGKTHPLSTLENLIRYDVEVSGFPSDHCGHICLLGLHEDDYPGTEEKQEWPSWDLPILKWAKGQGAITGVAHSGWGLDVFPETKIPNYKIPPMNGIGAQEFPVDAALHAIDFISTVDTPHVWELNMWYHVLNCGYEPKISGETDFPCIYGDRVGLGRSYVKIDKPRVDFETWVEGVRKGRSYVSDGFSHLMDFNVEGIEPGDGHSGKVDLEAPRKVRIRANVAAYLPVVPQEVFPGRGSSQTAEQTRRRTDKIKLRDLPYTQMPYWHVERARLGDSREVPVEVVVNGRPVARTDILADGTIRPVEFEALIERSSWVALRILASSHTNPVLVSVDRQPVLASKLSAQWCLDVIDQTWIQKAPNIRPRERSDARTAFEKAREAYRLILAGAYDDTGFISDADRSAMAQKRNAIKETLLALELKLNEEEKAPKKK